MVNLWIFKVINFFNVHYRGMHCANAISIKTWDNMSAVNVTCVISRQNPVFLNKLEL